MFSFKDDESLLVRVRVLCIKYFIVIVNVSLYESLSLSVNWLPIEANFHFISIHRLFMEFYGNSEQTQVSEDRFKSLTTVDLVLKANNVVLLQKHIKIKIGCAN
ncbi:hypothetical protein GWI33_001166 [Rhynchophorus ferrugineus]|uniref:Uncharacterized protein n=1 Tax=Rhynchophorus ferrugineus TaxID=354439 RepID=A0A834IZB3_RHYFE|nr:hypothetical protein GWI33_001166 [Rhynchophorus ferrugineus]